MYSKNWLQEVAKEMDNDPQLIFRSAVTEARRMLVEAAEQTLKRQSAASITGEPPAGLAEIYRRLQVARKEINAVCQIESLVRYAAKIQATPDANPDIRHSER